MADLPIILPLDFSEVLRKLEVSDPAHADLFNGLFQRLLTNDVFLKGMVEGLEQEIGNLDVATQAVNGLMSSTDKKKLDGIAAGANNYTHPATHPASIITESTTKRFVSDTEKANWNGKLGASAQATDSAKLGGQLPSYFAKASDLAQIGYVTGTYTGDDSSSRTINLGFQPTAVILMQSNGTTRAGASFDSSGGLALRGYPVRTGSNNNVTVMSISSNGFQVFNGDSSGFQQSNKSGRTYYYIAFR